MIEINFGKSDFTRYRPNGENIVLIPEKGHINSIALVRLGGDEYDKVMNTQAKQGKIKGYPAVLIQKPREEPWVHNYELFLLWIGERNEWVAIWYSEWCESGGKYDEFYTGPYAINDDCCRKILQAFGLSEAALPLDQVKKSSPSELEAMVLAGKEVSEK